MGCNGYLDAPPSNYVRFICYDCGREVKRNESFNVYHPMCDNKDGKLKVNIEFPPEYWER